MAENESNINDELDRLINEHNASAPAPKVIEAPKLEEDTEPGANSTRSEFKKHFLNDGFLSGLLLSVLVTGFSWGNAMVYNLVCKYILKNNSKVDWKKIKPEPNSEDEEEILDLVEMYSPKIMEYLDKLPDWALALMFIEYGFITRMTMAAEKVEEETIKEEPMQVEGHKMVYVITRQQSPKYWQANTDYTDDVKQAHHFDTPELANVAKNESEQVTEWKVTKK